jgi:hypothetical protein
MTTMLRRARGVVGTSLLWAAAWLLVTLPWLLLHWNSAGEDVYVPPLWAFGVTLVLIVAWGAAHGILFALIVMTVERGRSWGALRLPRVIAAGVAAGLAVPVTLGASWWWLTLPVDLPNALLGATVSATMGGSLAASTLLIARRGAAAALLPGEEEPRPR